MTKKQAAKKKSNGASTKPNGESSDFPIDVAQKLTELEAARWSCLDTEIRNHLQEIKIHQMESQLDEIGFQERQRVRQSQIVAINALVEIKKNRYQQLTDDLAAKYNVNKKNMVIDPDTRIIRSSENL